MNKKIYKDRNGVLFSKTPFGYNLQNEKEPIVIDLAHNEPFVDICQNEGRMHRNGVADVTVITFIMKDEK